MKPVGFLGTRRVAAALLLAIVVGSYGTSTLASTNDATVVSVKEDPLPLYATPEEGDPVAKIHVLGLPWRIKETKNDYYLVNIAGKDYWVDAMSVHASRTASASCLRQSAGSTIAADLGASTDRCK